MLLLLLLLDGDLLVGVDLLIRRARDSAAYSCFVEIGLAVAVAMTSPYLHLRCGMTALPVSCIVASLLSCHPPVHPSS